jgi:hypothetical protein
LFVEVNFPKIHNKFAPLWGTNSLSKSPDKISAAIAAAAVFFKIQEQEAANSRRPGGFTAAQLVAEAVRKH